jgi:hypothetical protein
MKKLVIIVISLTMLISCKNNFIEKNYELDYDPNEEIFLIIKNAGYSSVKIPGHILFYGHNKDFIIACQKNRDSIYNVNEHLVFDEMMNKIYKTKFDQFWIVQMHNDSIIGPLSRKEYFEVRKTIGIPATLKMDYSTLGFYLKGQRNDIEYKELDSDIIDTTNLKGNKTE